MEKTVPPAVSTRVSVDVFAARLIGVPPCGGADACGGFRVAKRVHFLACGSPTVRGAWWTASLETRCLGHRLTALEACCDLCHARVALG